MNSIEDRERIDRFKKRNQIGYNSTISEDEWFSEEDHPKGKLKNMHWIETLYDEDTGDPCPIKREVPYELNGKLLGFIPQGVVDRMSEQEKQERLL